MAGGAFDQVMTELTGEPAAAPLRTGSGGWLPSRLPVEAAAAATVSAALTAAARLRAHTTGGAAPLVGLDQDHLAAAFRSEAHARWDGEPGGTGFAPLSRFWPAADGWVRTHANYPWHRDALLRALGIADAAADPATVGARLATMPAAEVEAVVVANGGIAAAVRERSAPQGPLVGHSVIGDAAPRRGAAGDLPVSGVRVLDLTRVIAGPVGTRFLAALGADVLRLDPPHLPELPMQVLDGCVGKRSALLDARRQGDLLHALLDRADVVVHGWRPGALAAFGLDPQTLAERHPGLVVVQLSAWGEHEQRRGFDSIVQAASGIAVIESVDGRPGALPCQLLDHGTGYLVAAAALDGLLRQRSSGGTHLRTLSLAATASWLMDLPRPENPGVPRVLDPTPWLTTIGRLTAVTPPGSLDGEPLRWPSGLPTYGEDDPSW
jgi:hypothetical protein